ncbi:MAG: DUF421 domain-containing protein [Clostridia bacterium]|nr:DUF421 domain-containing protein [Clostridia bacterium]
MAVIVVRLVFVYLYLTIIVRFMGKRQIGEMQMSELVTAFMLSELAAMPVTDTQIPLLYCIIPVLVLACLEILVSFAFLRSGKLARLIAGVPVVVLRYGKIDRRALLSSRMTLAELMGELRQKGYPDPNDVAYAILEENGRLSVIAKKAAQPPDARTLARHPRETGICHTIIADGNWSAAGLSLSGHTAEDARHVLRQQGYHDAAEVFLMTVDDAGTWRIVPMNGE